MSKFPMILGIDPGTTGSGWVLYDPNDRWVVGYDLDTVKGRTDNEIFLAEILPQMNGDVIVVIEETASYGLPFSANLRETVRWSGRFEQQCVHMKTPVHYLSRRDIKMYLTGRCNTKDGNVIAALTYIVGPKGTKDAPGPCFGLSGDKWQALAGAVTYAETVMGVEK